MYVCLTEQQAQAIIDHARADYPNEACGVIAGHGQQASEIISLPNIAADPRRNYRFDDRRFTETLFALEKRGLSLIGFYHSHPDTDPLPSSSDIQQATYSNTAYIIVSLRNNDPRMTAWHINYGSVLPLELYIGADCPKLPADDSLSPAQRNAIIIGAVVAFLFMLILSVTLLPPAPIIP